MRGMSANEGPVETGWAPSWNRSISRTRAYPAAAALVLASLSRSTLGGLPSHLIEPLPAITFDATPYIAGMIDAPGYITIKLFANGALIGSTTAVGGNWALCSPPLPDGVYTFTAVASDASGDSAPSEPVATTIDTEPPLPPIDVAAIGRGGKIDLIWTPPGASTSGTSEKVRYIPMRKRASEPDDAYIRLEPGKLVEGTSYCDDTVEDPVPAAENAQSVPISYVYVVLASDGALPTGFPDFAGDVDKDHKLTINELTKFLFNWLSGFESVEDATRAGYLWRGGRNAICHTFNASAPETWIRCEPRTAAAAETHEEFASWAALAQRSSRAAVGSALSTAVRAFSTPWYVFDVPIIVSIDAAPTSGAMAWAVEDVVPRGWEIESADGNGVFDSLSHKVKWGPFVGNDRRAFSYRITPQAGSSRALFRGVLSADGVSASTSGAGVLTAYGDLNGNERIDLRDFKSFQLCFGSFAVSDCASADFNRDSIVDAVDFGAFSRSLTGP